MKNYFLAIIIFNSIFLTFAIAQQQQYPNLWNIQIHSSISYNKYEQMYYYTYSMANNPSNIGSIAEIEIDISRKSGTLDIDTSGLRFKNDGYTEEDFRLSFPHLKGRIIPVGFLKTPVGDWTGGLSNALTASFGGIGTSHVQPGGSVSGFEMMSKGLPSIRQCIVSPFFDVIALFPDPADTTITYYVPPVDSVRNAVNYYGWTIGPTAPLINFIASVWCDTLTSYTTQSRTLDWIKDDTTANKYLSYFASAKTKLTQRDSTGARTVLLQILRDVDIDSTSSLTSEAYALLRFNTEYILKSLP
jgi:hypothetical protein